MYITDAKREKALLLHYAGEDVNNIFKTLTLEEATEEESVLDQTLRALYRYFMPKKNL